jgi:mRNA-degrading endonuclease RelE of RelBE toxin-antitoxin system
MPFFVWAPTARAAIRNIEQSKAREILIALTQYARSGEGDVLAMRGKPSGRLRLRSGDYRMIFRKSDVNTFQILKVGHRRDIYRDR